MEGKGLNMKQIYEKIKKLLEKTSEQYPGFTDSIIEELEHFHSKNPNAAYELCELLEHRDLTASEVTLYESQLIGIPFPDENGVYHRWGMIISEEEAQKIIENEYCEE